MDGGLPLSYFTLWVMQAFLVSCPGFGGQLVMNT
jgi:hypothetical protein